MLADIPDTINDLYRAGLGRLAANHSETQNIWIREVFSWIALPPQDLTIAELEAGITVTRKARFNRDTKHSDIDIDRILTACGAFVRVYIDASTNQKTVSIIHNTFATFLNSRKECQPQFFLDRYEILHFRTIACISYLSDTTLPYIDDSQYILERQAQWDKE